MSVAKFPGSANRREPGILWVGWFGGWRASHIVPQRNLTRF